MPDLEIWCGSSLSLPLPNDSVDLVVFSPPYEDARQYGDLAFRLKEGEWVRWMVRAMTEYLRVCKGLVACVVNGRTRSYEWSGVPLRLWCALADLGYAMRKPLLYHRNGIPGSGGPDWFADCYEFVLCAQKTAGPLPWSDNTAMGHPPVYPPGGAMSHRTPDGARKHTKRNRDGSIRVQTYTPPALANPGNIIRCVVGGGRMGHEMAHENEAPYPERIPEWFIRSACPPGGIVLDPMAGSGTTLAAAIKAGRKAIGVDIRMGQCELMRRRLAAECAVSAEITPIGEEAAA